jgi:ankyrin repeat protein
MPDKASAQPEAEEVELSGQAWASAIAAGNVEAVLRLIFAGMNANTPADGHPSCVAAVRADAAAVLEQLIKAGADPNAVDPGNITPLYLAARDGKRECARVLLEAMKVLSVESDRGWPVKSVTPAVDRNLVDDANGHTALMAAIVNQQPNDFIGFLLDHGLDASRRGMDGRFPLWIASERNNVELADLLLKKRAHRNALAPTGQSALILAAQLGHTEMVEFLISQRVNLASRDHERRTARGWARRNGHAAAARALEDAGAPE